MEYLVLKLHINVLLKFWPTVLTCTVDSNPPWQVGVAFHAVRESKAPDQTQFCAPMDPQEESVMSWNNIILPLLHWAIRFGLVHTRKKMFCVRMICWEHSGWHILRQSPSLPPHFRQIELRKYWQGLVRSEIQDLNVQWIQQWDGMDEDDVKTQTRHELPEPKVCTEKNPTKKPSEIVKVLNWYKNDKTIIVQ